MRRAKKATGQQSPVRWSTLMIIYFPAFDLLPLNTHVHTNCPPKNTEPRCSHPQKFCMVLLNVYPIQSSYAVINLVIEDARPAHTHSRSDVKIFTLFVNSRKHFVKVFSARLLPSRSHTKARPVLLAFLGVKAYCSQTGWGSHTRLRKGDSALTPRIAQKDAILHLTRIVPTKGSWPTCFLAGLCLPAAVMVLRVFFCPSAAPQTITTSNCENTPVAVFYRRREWMSQSTGKPNPCPQRVT